MKILKVQYGKIRKVASDVRQNGMITEVSTLVGFRGEPNPGKSWL